MYKCNLNILNLLTVIIRNHKMAKYYKTFNSLPSVNSESTIDELSAKCSPNYGKQKKNFFWLLS